MILRVHFILRLFSTAHIVDPAESEGTTILNNGWKRIQEKETVALFILPFK